MSDTNNNLNIRYWLLSNIDMVLAECYYHRENSIYYSAPRLEVWSWGADEGCQKIFDETTG